MAPKIKTISFPLHATSVPWKHTGCIALDIVEWSIHNYPGKGNSHIQGMRLTAHNSWLEVVLKTKFPAPNRNWTLVFSVNSQSFFTDWHSWQDSMVFLVYMAHINDHFLSANLRQGAWLTRWDACTWSVRAPLLLLMVSVFSQNRNINETSCVPVWCIC